MRLLELTGQCQTCRDIFTVCLEKTSRGVIVLPDPVLSMKGDQLFHRSHGEVMLFGGSGRLPLAKFQPLRESGA